MKTIEELIEMAKRKELDGEIKRLTEETKLYIAELKILYELKKLYGGEDEFKKEPN